MSSFNVHVKAARSKGLKRRKTSLAKKDLSNGQEKYSQEGSIVKNKRKVIHSAKLRKVSSRDEDHVSTSVQSNLKSVKHKNATILKSVEDDQVSTSVTGNLKSIKHKSATKRKSSVDDLKGHSVKKPHGTIKKRKKDDGVTGKRSKPKGCDGPTTLLLRNLPQGVTYALLNDLVPDAVHYELYKKHKKRHAFAKFQSVEACAAARSQLNGRPVEGHQLHVTFAVEAGKPLDPVDHENSEKVQCLTVSNLPFAITKAQLDEEFPTASSIVLNTNSKGRFRGSCLLQFESTDDCSVMMQACRARLVGGRAIKCRPGVQFSPREPQQPLDDDKQKQAPKKLVLKLTKLPLLVTKEGLQSQFGASLQDVRLFANDSDTDKTALLEFGKQAALAKARHLCNEEKVFGPDVQARPWAPPKRKRPFKLVTLTAGESKSQLPNTTGQVPCQKPERPSKKRNFTADFDVEHLPGNSVHDLEYANDIVLLGDNTLAMRGGIDRLVVVMSRYSMCFAPVKCKYYFKTSGGLFPIYP